MISDRYSDLTTVYQGLVGGVDSASIAVLHHLACNGLIPDITFLLDMDEDDGLGRADERGGDEPGLRARDSLSTRRCAGGFLSWRRVSLIALSF